MKFLKWALFAATALALVLAAAIWFYFNSKKPESSAELSLPGLSKPVEVLFDEHGIPHIYAENEQDAYCALGYVHARDRLFQMEMLRRLADGRLSEIIGEKTLEVDKFFRTLSIRQHANHTLSTIYKNKNDSTFLAAQAYYRGVNHFLETGKTPPEFDILGIPKQPFSLEDGLVVAGYMGFSFTDAFDTEGINSYVLEKLGPEYLKDLSNDWDSAAVRIPVQRLDAKPGFSKNEISGETNSLLSLSSSLQEIERFCQTMPAFHGSNAWVLAPSRTKNGKVIFENDTHIAFSQPSVWYEANLNYGGYSVYGNFIAGAPVPVLGHTNDYAWGLTMFENDDVDFFKETINPGNPSQAKFMGVWEEMTIRQETIKVKDGAEVVLPVKKTRHGYLIDEVAKSFKTRQPADPPANQPLSMWWIYHQRPDRSLEAFYKMAHAKNIQDFERAAALIHSPGLNVMYGDAAGNIAWWAAGLLPKYPAHVNSWLVLDGASGKDEIEGWLPFSENPHSVNPASGFVYSANNQPEQVGTNRSVSGYYVPEDRARRILDLLSGEKKDWTAEEVRLMALDNVNPVFPKIVQRILPDLQNVSHSGAEASALAVLEKWNGSHDLTDLAPTVFYRFLHHFYQNTFRDELGGEGMKLLFASHVYKRLLDPLTRNENSIWWDDVSTPNEKETRAQIIQKSFRQAIEDLPAGDPATVWQWQNFHTLTHRHPLGVLPVAGKYFNVGPLPVPGGRETLNNLDFPLDSTGHYQVTYGPALRRIVDFSSPENAMSINPTGQSGLLNSPFYDDQAEMFASGKFRHEWMNRADVERVKTGRLVFR